MTDSSTGILLRAPQGLVPPKKATPNRQLARGDRIIPFRRMSYIRRRRIITSTKSTIEIGEITKSNIECHRADAAIAKSRVAQHPVRARKALAEDKGGEGELFAFEKLMQVTRRYPLPLRDCGNGQIAVAEFAVMSDMIARNACEGARENAKKYGVKIVYKRLSPRGRPTFRPLSAHCRPPMRTSSSCARIR